MSDNYISLHTLFKNMQHQMAAKLVSASECLIHPVSKGDASEDCWREMLRNLPTRYCVDKAQVIDHEGQLSDAIDIVIYDRQYSPFVFKQGEAIYVPAESVYAVIEAKPEINKEYLQYAAEKARSVRRLKRTNAKFQWMGGAGKKADLFPIAAGIVALRSAWTPALGEPFKEKIIQLEQDPMTRLDFGCAVTGGTFDLHYPVDKVPTIFTATGEMTLMTFFLKLIARLQCMGTVPAIDIDSYLAAIHK